MQVVAVVLPQHKVHQQALVVMAAVAQAMPTLVFLTLVAVEQVVEISLQVVTAVQVLLLLDIQYKERYGTLR